MPNVIIKFCKRCNAETERYVSSGCKPCSTKRSAIWYKANSERVKEKVAEYRADNLERVKAKQAEYNAANPDRARARWVAWYAVNREKAKAYTAAWQKANPESCRIITQNRRARKLANGGKLSKGLSAKLFKLQKGKCPCCNQPLGDNYHMDHIMPIKRGGANEDLNIQLLRQQCNQQKSAKDPIEFMQSRGKLL